MGQLLTALLVVAAMQTVASPREIVQAAIRRVVTAVQQPRSDGPGAVRGTRAGTDGEHAELRRIAGGLFDFDEMAHRSLSRHWSTLTRDEQVEFVQLFTVLLERTYLSRVQSFAHEQIVYVGEEIDGSFALVKSRVLTARSGETALDYRLRLKDGQWKIYDVLVDGVSFVSTYRSEFNRVIQSASYAGLLQRLREKVPFPPATTLRPSGN